MRKNRVATLIATVVLVLLVQIGVIAPAANATTDYDDLIQLTGTLEVKSSSSSSPIYITDTYETYMPNNSLCYTSNYSSYETARDSGWVTTYQYEVGPNGAVHVIVAWMVSSLVNPGYSSQFVETGSPGGAAFAIFYTHYFAFSTSDDSSVSVTCSINSGNGVTGEILYSNSPSVTPARAGVGIYTSTHGVTYPTGYNGKIMPGTPPVAVARTGTVDCGGEDVDGMTVYQGGNIGAANLTPLTLGRAEWAYDLLSNASYTIVVDCGGELVSSSAPVQSSVGPHDWYCDPYGEAPYYCVLG